MPRAATDWISLREAAEIFSAANVPISRSTLGRWVRNGKLQSVRPGRRIFVRRSEVRAMLRPRPPAARPPVLQPGLFEDPAQ